MDQRAAIEKIGDSGVRHHYRIDSDQPAVCPRCGGRTDWEDSSDGTQRHTCLKPACRFTFVAEVAEG